MLWFGAKMVQEVLCVSEPGLEWLIWRIWTIPVSRSDLGPGGPVSGHNGNLKYIIDVANQQLAVNVMFIHMQCLSEDHERTHKKNDCRKSQGGTENARIQKVKNKTLQSGAAVCASLGNFFIRQDEKETPDKEDETMKAYSGSEVQIILANQKTQPPFKLMNFVAL